MEEQAWLITILQDLLATSIKLEERAFYQGLIDLANEQIKRLDQSSGELDGRIWNPSRWG
ncbi:hypothetical protein [Periweissella fabalis]|uniref:Uncharacterized protein n=1 Tax=Periweissella fabalis TaxID=1070421 RepID=A0A7X6N599_9LACO|nr:hypothetical protein [Periweissella fabalis]MCM0599675.1 hypothetical protein [Periweissella fabalis]NKZ24912.1 hypothetical protein [Periweissella fabalis]